jgi:hypothetical protein
VKCSWVKCGEVDRSGVKYSLVKCRSGVKCSGVE